ncbi:hypothetical protein HMPREF7215_1999 [Pyramidobacter piscolens W5455]|uniref:Uncharacterized protein n=1 Tax=Pyramidobacter piscolens W5455 TaxID=352165 RepID=A0ABP2HQR2_9BACT|nr:hypothetical protein HMPREF7215_1999 [Pyramidobacter piscolens W5455]
MRRHGRGENVVRSRPGHFSEAASCFSHSVADGAGDGWNDKDVNKQQRMKTKILFSVIQ